MNKEQLDHFREKLEVQGDDLQRSLVQVNKEGRILYNDDPQDLGDRSVASLSRHLLFLHGAQKRQLIREIEAALERIREGAFGQCINCGNEIAVKRLEAMPFTAYCRDCQEVLESRRDSATEELSERSSHR